MASRFVSVLDKEIHYTEFGNKETAAVTVVMVHGFVRTCRDFDVLGRYLHESCNAWVLCPDIIGRGHSQWSDDPEKEYNPLYYANLVGEMLSLLGVTSCVYFGTSMGGIIAMIGIGAKTKLESLVAGLVLNDVGPHVNPAALQRIMGYVLNPPVATRATEFIEKTAEMYRPFGYDLTAEERWRLQEPTMRRFPDGRIGVHWDPAIVKGLKPPPPGAPDLWFFYDLLKCPTLVVRGEDSDVLLHETLTEMQQRGPKPDVLIMSRCGHAPVFFSKLDCEKLLPFVQQFVPS